MSKRACLFLPAASSFAEATWRPAVDVYRTRTGWLAKFDLAGVRLEDIHLQLHGSTLCIKGIRRDWVFEEGCCYHSLEIHYNRFERCLEFPADLQNARFTTEYQSGMLLVRIDTGEKNNE